MNRLTVIGCFSLALALQAAAAERASAQFSEIEAMTDLAAARAAVKSVWDSAVLSEIASKSANWRLRADAVYFTCEQSVVAAATSDADWRVRAAAAYKLIDQTALRRIAETDTDERVRAAAASRVLDTEFKQAFIAKSASEAAKNVVIKSLPKEVLEAKEVAVPLAKETPIETVTLKPQNEQTREVDSQTIQNSKQSKTRSKKAK